MTKALHEKQRRVIDDAIRAGLAPRAYWLEQSAKLRAIEIKASIEKLVKAQVEL